MFTNLLIVAAAGLLAPLALGFFPRVRLPAIVLEIVLGIVIGPSGLGWVKPDAPITILALVGLAFLLFLSGLGIDVDRLRGRIVKLTALGFAVSFVIAILIGIGLRSGGFVKSPLFVAIVLVATSLGVTFPVLKDSGTIDSRLGQFVIAAASIAEFGSIILLSLFFSGMSSTSTRAADSRDARADRRRPRALSRQRQPVGGMRRPACGPRLPVGCVPPEVWGGGSSGWRARACGGCVSWPSVMVRTDAAARVAADLAPGAR
jgi:predicted Kef-type K+ transport protein